MIHGVTVLGCTPETCFGLMTAGAGCAADESRWSYRSITLDNGRRPIARKNGEGDDANAGRRDNASSEQNR